MKRKDLEEHFDKINYYPIDLVYDIIQVEINDLREGQIEINEHCNSQPDMIIHIENGDPW